MSSTQHREKPTSPFVHPCLAQPCNGRGENIYYSYRTPSLHASCGTCSNQDGRIASACRDALELGVIRFDLTLPLTEITTLHPLTREQQPSKPHQLQCSTCHLNFLLQAS